ncbi:MAG: phage baseplate assembly protein [Thermoguttaceae bacterium]
MSSRPTSGKQYTIVKGDTLSGIAATAYGSGHLWRRIWQANQTRLKSGSPERIYPGEVIIIPGLVEIESAKAERSTAAPRATGQDATITIRNKAIPIESCSVVRSIDTALDGWSMTTFFNVDDPEFYKLVIPYQYGEQAKSLVYLGSELAGTGYYYKPSTDTASQKITLEFWSKPTDMLDSVLKPGTYEANKIKLSQRAEQLAEPHGVKVIYDLKDDGLFDRIKADKTETKGAHLLKLAKQRGGLMTSTAKGELLFTQAATGSPVAALVENTPPLLPTSASYDGRARYGSYLAFGQTTGKTKSSTAVDENVSSSRFLAFTADDTRAGDIQTAADWQRNKAIADSMSISLPVSDWYDADGNLFRENTIIEVFAPSLFISKPTPFLIRSVTYEYTVDNGRAATLDIVPPSVYTGGKVLESWLS